MVVHKTCPGTQHSQQTLKEVTPTKSIKLILALHIVSQFTSARTSMKAASNFLLTAILSALFIWQAWSTISKYQAARTTLEVSIIILDGYDRVS